MADLFKKFKAFYKLFYEEYALRKQALREQEQDDWSCEDKLDDESFYNKESSYDDESCDNEPYNDESFDDDYSLINEPSFESSCNEPSNDTPC